MVYSPRLSSIIITPKPEKSMPVDVNSVQKVSFVTSLFHPPIGPPRRRGGRRRSFATAPHDTVGRALPRLSPQWRNTIRRQRRGQKTERPCGCMNPQGNINRRKVLCSRAPVLPMDCTLLYYDEMMPTISRSDQQTPHPWVIATQLSPPPHFLLSQFLKALWMANDCVFWQGAKTNAPKETVCPVSATAKPCATRRRVSGGQANGSAPMTTKQPGQRSYNRLSRRSLK